MKLKASQGIKTVDYVITNNKIKCKQVKQLIFLTRSTKKQLKKNREKTKEKKHTIKVQFVVMNEKRDDLSHKELNTHITIFA